MEQAFRLALLRSPTPEESDRCRVLLPRRSLPELWRALLDLTEFVHVD